MIHTIKINYSTIKSTLLEYGIEILNFDMNPKSLRIRSLHSTPDTHISECTLPKDVNFEHDVYTIIGINGQSCRGLHVLQAEQLLNSRQKDRKDGNLVLLIRGGKVTLTAQTDDCLCGKGCNSDYPADCCTIQ